MQVGRCFTFAQKFIQFISDLFYPGAESLFNRPLILARELKSPVDVRYKTDYFPRTGPNADSPQAPRYLHTVDEGQEIIIKVHLQKLEFFSDGIFLVSGRLFTTAESRSLYSRMLSCNCTHDESILHACQQISAKSYGPKRIGSKSIICCFNDRTLRAR